MTVQLALLGSSFLSDLWTYLQDYGRELAFSLPLVVRLEGTNVEKGREILKSSGLAITPAGDLDDAAQKACAAIGVKKK